MDISNIPEDGVKYKDGESRFVFPDMRYQDSPNKTKRECATVSKTLDLSVLKYHEGNLIQKTEQDLLEDLLKERKEKGDAIVSYLEDYLNGEAKRRGYNTYHSAMIYTDSSIPQFREEGKAFFDCADAIWAYVKGNKDSFTQTGQPDLEAVKLSHPKLEDYLV